MLNSLLPAMTASARRSADERARAHAAAIEREARDRRPQAGAFSASLRVPGIRIIAECKRRSPSRGVLKAKYDPAAIALGYEMAGAAAVSVLTEPSFFDGALDHLRAVRAATRVPLLRKDFIVTEFQVLEARAAGADAILLIAAALDDAMLAKLMSAARGLDLAALVEIHTREELTRAVQAGAVLVGVNSRDLQTLQVRPDVFEELVLGLPNEAIAVAERGLRSVDDVRRLRAEGYDAFLIGEHFMVEGNPGAALAEFRAAAGAELEDLR
jgi:indole-3-glycerol phosphate synthase